MPRYRMTASSREKIRTEPLTKVSMGTRFPAHSLQATVFQGNIICKSWSHTMKNPVPVESASAFIDAKIKDLGDWRGKTLAKVRELIHAADPEIVEERKWVRATSPGTPVFSHSGIVCTGETYKNVVKITFAKGAALKDPVGLFNSSLEGNVRRAIDIHEGDKLDEAALKDLIRAAVGLNLKGKNKPKPRRKSPL